MMDDSLVSRQAVKDIMFNIRTNRYNNDKHFAELCLEEFDAIPSTQPEIKTDGDMISRQQTIDALMQEFKRIPTNSIRAKIVVENLPSAQPETNCSEFPNGSDTISRQAAIDALKNRWKKTRNYEGIGDDIAEECELYLKQVPSAQPERKTGRWTKIHWKAFRCSECNRLSEFCTDFCPNCGSPMEKEGEG